MTLTVERLEFFIIILVRISAFIATAPFFSQRSVPRSVKAGFAVFMSIIIYNTIDYDPLVYKHSVDYVILILKESIIGLSIGYMASLCIYILDFSGRILDTEIGFSMVSVLNPNTNFETSISGSMYTYFVMLIMLVSNMHYFIISAIVDTFKFIPIGKEKLPPKLYEIPLNFMTKYFMIGFRIVIPIFACILVVNVVLGVLAKVAPQMNMFVIGMQLKLLVGLSVVFITISLLPSMTDFIFGQMKYVVSDMIKALSP